MIDLWFWFEVRLLLLVPCFFQQHVPRIQIFILNTRIWRRRHWWIRRQSYPGVETTGFFGGDIGGFGGTGGFIGISFWTRRRWWRKCSRHTGQIRLPVTSIPMYRKQKTWPQVLRTALGRRRGQTEQFPSAVTTKMGGLEKRRASALPFLFCIW